MVNLRCVFGSHESIVRIANLPEKEYLAHHLRGPILRAFPYLKKRYFHIKVHPKPIAAASRKPPTAYDADDNMAHFVAEMKRNTIHHVEIVLDRNEDMYVLRTTGVIIRCLMVAVMSLAGLAIAAISYAIPLFIAYLVLLGYLALWMYVKQYAESRRQVIVLAVTLVAIWFVVLALLIVFARENVSDAWDILIVCWTVVIEVLCLEFVVHLSFVIRSYFVFLREMDKQVKEDMEALQMPVTKWDPHSVEDDKEDESEKVNRIKKKDRMRATDVSHLAPSRPEELSDDEQDWRDEGEDGSDSGAGAGMGRRHGSFNGGARGKPSKSRRRESGQSNYEVDDPPEFLDEALASNDADDFADEEGFGHEDEYVSARPSNRTGQQSLYDTDDVVEEPVGGGADNEYGGQEEEEDEDEADMYGDNDRELLLSH
eukprot:ANDGO_07011.mRNA.1 hypothetical protein